MTTKIESTLKTFETYTGHGIILEIPLADLRELARLRPALELARLYIAGQQVADALVAIDGKPESEWPTLRAVIDQALGIPPAPEEGQ